MKAKDYKKQYEQLEKFILKQSNFEIKNGDTIADVVIRELEKTSSSAPLPKVNDWNNNVHEFEKYPELAEQMQEYASFGRFADWQKFTDVLNETLRKASKNLVKADVPNSAPVSPSDAIEFAEWIVKKGIKDSAAEGMWLIMHEGSNVDIKQRISSKDLYTLFKTEK